ncbi:MAG: hypothetical protein WBF52_19000, partial [Geitlerinemataceae cyanobacterium]
MKITWQLAAILAVAIVFFPSPVLANAGTSLMWGVFFYLVVGNFLLGAVEGWLLSKWFRTPLGRSQSSLVVANYASACIGKVLLGNRLSKMPQVTL